VTPNPSSAARERVGEEHLAVDRRSKSYAFFVGIEQQGNWMGYTDENEPERIAELNGIRMETA
jgi:hypothetical protein